jgi:hypothetical protein
MSDKDGQPPVPDVVTQPRQCLPSHHRLAIVPPVLVKYLSHARQLLCSRFG